MWAASRAQDSYYVGKPSWLVRVSGPELKKDRVDGWEGVICAKARSCNLMRPSPGFL